MRTAAAYLRVSTEKQDEYSLDSQLKLIRDYAAGHDFIVPDEFVFTDDGISGRSAKKRPAFTRMIGLAKEKDHPFEAILVWKFSRFARNLEESVVYKSMLSRSGVEVISISEPLADGPFGSLIERILEWMDEFYSIRLSGEVKRGMAEKISRGEAAYGAPYGYMLEGKRFVPHPAEAEVVRRVFRDYLAGVGILQITRRLAAEGVRTKFGNEPDNRFYEYLLRNPVYIGKLRWCSDGRGRYERGETNDAAYLADGQHEPIIDLATWEAVQQKLDAGKRGRLPYSRNEQPVDFMLKGLVRCSSCGSTLVYGGGPCPFLQCHKYSRGKCPTSHALSVAKANRLIIAYLQQAAETMSFPVAPHTVKRSRSGPDYDHLIAVEQVKLRRVQDAYESGIDSLAEYARKKQRLLAGIADLERQAAAASAQEQRKPVDLLARLDKVLQVLDVIRSPDATEAAKNEALRSVVSYIVYDKPSQRLEIYFYF